MTFTACVLGVSFDKVRAFDLDSETSQGQGQGRVKVVREQLMTEDTKDVEPLVDELAANFTELYRIFGQLLTLEFCKITEIFSISAV